jgi:hypothetical protein
MGTSGSGQVSDERWGFTGSSASCVAVRRVSSLTCVPVLLRFFLDVRGIVATLLP